MMKNKARSVQRTDRFTNYGNAKTNTEVASFLADNDFHNEEKFNTKKFVIANGEG